MRQKTKRFVTLGLVVALLVLLCFAAIACGQSTPKKTPANKTASGITVTVTNTSYTFDKTTNTINITEDDAFDLQKSDITVTVKYSDNTTATLKESDYSIDTSALPSPLTSGTYAVSVTYGSFTESINVVVLEAQKQSATLYTEGVSVRYDGTKKSLIAEYDRLHAQNRLSKLVSDGKVSLDPVKVEETDAGTYYMTVTPKKGYILNEGMDESVQLSFTITPAIIQTPTVIGSTTFEYDGTEKTLNLDLHGQDDILTFVNGGVDTRKGTIVGSYTCQMLILPEKQANYAFDEGNSTPVGSAVDVATFTITPKILSAPVVVGKEKDNDGFYHFTYTGERILPTLSVDGTELVATFEPNTGNYVYAYGDDSVSISLSSFDYEAVDAFSGNSYADQITYHEIVCTLVGENTDNYRWASADTNVRFVIDQAVASLPEDIGDNLQFVYPYTGEAITLGENGGRAQVNCYVNDYYTLLTNGSFETTRVIPMNNLMLKPDSVTYLTNNNVPFVITPYNEDTFSYTEGSNYEFTFKQAFILKESGSGVAEVGKKYPVTIVYRKGLSSSNAFTENYVPVEIEAEVEIVKGPLIVYENTQTTVLRSDDASSTKYSLNKNGEPMPFRVVADLSVPVLSVTNFFRRTENDAFAPTSDLTQAGEYRSEFALDFDKNNYVGILQNNTLFSVIDSYVYDWNVAKREFYTNGTDNSIDFYIRIRTGEILYSAGAHYTEFFPEDNGINSNVNVPVQEVFTVWYKATEEDTYEVLEPVDGKYDFFRNGYYKLRVDLEYDDDNFTAYPINERTWTLQREELSLDPASCFNESARDFSFDGQVWKDGDVLIEYKANEEDAYAAVDENNDLSAAGYYRASVDIDYDDFNYSYEVNGEPSYRVVYEWTKQ